MIFVYIKKHEKLVLLQEKYLLNCFCHSVQTKFHSNSLSMEFTMWPFRYSSMWTCDG